DGLLAGKTWTLPGPREVSIKRGEAGPVGSAPDWSARAPRNQARGQIVPPVPPTSHQWTWRADEGALIQLAVADLIFRHGSRLRACANEKCKAPFVAVKRQQYCGATCTKI